MEPNFKIKCRGVITLGDKILVVRHSKNAEFFAFPGGHLEYKEDPRKCIEREIFEELGIRPKVGNLIYINTFIAENMTHYVEFFFEILNGKDYLDLSKLSGTHRSEIVELKWIDKNENINLRPQEIHRDFQHNNFPPKEVKFVG